MASTEQALVRFPTAYLPGRKSGLAPSGAAVLVANHGFEEVKVLLLHFLLFRVLLHFPLCLG